MKKALILIDLQNDFMPGGALGVEGGFDLLEKANLLLEKPFDAYIASKDWHPKEHESFALNHNLKVGDTISLNHIQQILWPVHCVQGTLGAEFALGWHSEKIEKIVYKGTDRKVDGYSIFFDNAHLKSTLLHEYLQSQGITDLYLAGIATDYCVYYSAKDALLLGYKVYILKECCKAVNLEKDDGEKALASLQKAGAHIVTLEQLNF